MDKKSMALPLSFFEKQRQNVIPSKNHDDKIMPFIFSNNKEVKKGNFKDKVIIKLPNNGIVKL